MVVVQPLRLTEGLPIAGIPKCLSGGTVERIRGAGGSSQQGDGRGDGENELHKTFLSVKVFG